MSKISEESKKKIIQEVKTVGSITAVAKKHSIPVSTLHTWVTKASKTGNSNAGKKPGSKIDRDKFRKLEKKLREAELENQILRDLLKKTNHAWLGE